MLSVPTDGSLGSHMGHSRPRIRRDGLKKQKKEQANIHIIFIPETHGS